MSNEFTEPSETDLFLKEAVGETMNVALLAGRRTTLPHSKIEATSRLILRLITTNEEKFRPFQCTSF